MDRVRSALQSLRVRIPLIVALCWLLPTLVLGVFMSGYFIDALSQKTEQALVAEATYAQDLTAQEITRLIAKSRDVTYDGLLAEYLSLYQSGAVTYEHYYQSARAYWQRTFQREPQLLFSAAVLYDGVDTILYNTADNTALSAFERGILPAVLAVSETLDTESYFGQIDGRLFHIRNLYDRYMQQFGVLTLEIAPGHLFAALMDPVAIWRGKVDLRLDDYVHMSGGGAPDFEIEGGMRERAGQLTYGQRINKDDFTLSYRVWVSGDAVHGQAREYYRVVLLLVLLLLPIEAVIMFFLHRHMVSPITQLSHATKRLADGDLGITVPTRGQDDELDQLANSFNTMSLHIEELIDTSYREQLALRDARIEALQSRINPHFLNNALELINWQARLEGDEGISQMIEALSVLMNAALDRFDQRLVPLSSELEIARAYLFFVHQRYGERINTDIQAESGLGGVMVPRLIIQTLLENAVEHGISPAGGGGIRLNVYERQEMLYIDVRNGGKSLTDADLQRIHQLLEDSTQGGVQSQHLGIRNINLRLKLIYGKRASLSFQTDGSDTLARIVIPFQKQYGGQA